jgi:hypothetical protein
MLRTRRSGDAIPEGRNFLYPSRLGFGPTQPSTHQVPGGKAEGKWRRHPPHLAPRLKKEYSYIFTTLSAFTEGYWVTFTFTSEEEILNSFDVGTANYKYTAVTLAFMVPFPEEL